MIHQLGEPAAYAVIRQVTGNVKVVIPVVDMEALAREVNEAMSPVIEEALQASREDNGAILVDVKLNDTGWSMLSTGWFAPASRPQHERIDGDPGYQPRLF